MASYSNFFDFFRFDFQNEWLENKVGNSYWRSFFFGDDDDDEDSDVLKKIKRSEYLYLSSSEEQKKIIEKIERENPELLKNGRNSPEFQNALSQGIINFENSKKEQTLKKYVKLRATKDSLVDRYNNNISNSIQSLKDKLENDEDLDEAEKSVIKNQITILEKNQVKTSKIVAEKDELFLEVDILGHKIKVKDGVIEFLTNNDISREDIEVITEFLTYNPKVLGELSADENVDPKIEKILDDIDKDKKRTKIENIRDVYTDNSSNGTPKKTEDHLLDKAEEELPLYIAKSYKLRDISVNVDSELVSKESEPGGVKLKDRSVKSKVSRVKGQEAILDHAKSQGYDLRRNLQYRKRNGWDCYYFMNSSVEKWGKQRLATRNPDNGEIKYHYKYFIATKPDSKGNVSFQYGSANEGAKMPFEVWEKMAETTYKTGGTHLLLLGVRGEDVSDARKACAQELIIPRGPEVNISFKHIGLLEIAAKDKGEQNPEVHAFARRLAEEMKRNTLAKGRDLTEEEQNLYNKMMNREDIESFGITNYSLSKFKIMFEGFENDFKKMAPDMSGKVDVYQPLTKMMALEDLYRTYEKIILTDKEDDNKLDDTGNVTTTVGEFMDALEVKYPGIKRHLSVSVNTVPMDKRLFDLSKLGGGGKFGKVLFDYIQESQKTKDKAMKYMENEYASKGRPEVSNETVAKKAIQGYSSVLAEVSRDFKELVNDKNYNIYITNPNTTNLTYTPSGEAVKKYNENWEENKKKHIKKDDEENESSEKPKKEMQTYNPMYENYDYGR